MIAWITVHVTVEQIVGAIVGAAAFIGAVGYLWRKGKRLVRLIVAIHALLEQAATVVGHELTHNSGSSMKDDVAGLAVAMGAVSRQIDNIDDRLDNVETVLTQHLRGPRVD